MPPQQRSEKGGKKVGLGNSNVSIQPKYILDAAAKSLQSCPTPETPETAAHQAPPSLGFSRQEHWSGLPFPSPLIRWGKNKWNSQRQAKWNDARAEFKKLRIKFTGKVGLQIAVGSSDKYNDSPKSLEKKRGQVENYRKWQSPHHHDVIKIVSFLNTWSFPIKTLTI